MYSLESINKITNSLVRYLLTQNPKTNNPYEIYNSWSLETGYRFNELNIVMICISLIKNREKILAKSELVLSLIF